MSFLHLAIVVVAMFAGGLESEAKTMNCDGVPYKTLEELFTGPTFEALRNSRSNANPITFADISQVFTCNTVARPAIWINYVTSEIIALNQAVLENVSSENSNTFPWLEFEEVLKDDAMGDQVAKDFETIYQKGGVKNFDDDATHRVLLEACHQVNSNFKQFFDVFQSMGEAVRNDHLIYNMAEYDENLKRLVVAYLSCQKLQF